MFVAIVQIPMARRPREAAVDSARTPDWEKRMEAAFGARPVVTYYDNHVIVDNEAGKVRIEGEG
jgi:hypothetical protein